MLQPVIPANAMLPPHDLQGPMEDLRSGRHHLRNVKVGDPMSSDDVARTLRSTGVKPFPRSGTATPRVGARHMTAADAAPWVRAKSARSRSGTCFELTLPTAWKKDSR